MLIESRRHFLFSKHCLPEEIKVIRPLSRFHNIFWKKLAIVVTHPLTAVVTIVVLVAYWYFSIYGILNVKVDLSIQKMAPQEARIVQFKNEYDRAIKVGRSLKSDHGVGFRLPRRSL